MNFVQLHLHYLCYSCRMSRYDPSQPLYNSSLAFPYDCFVHAHYGNIHLWNFLVSAPVFTLYHLWSGYNNLGFEYFQIFAIFC